MQGQTGSYVTTTLIAAPSSAALTTLATVRDELDITDANDTSNDARLTRFINEESAGIARYCNRIFGLATWRDQFRLSRGVWGEGVREANNPLKLSRYPLLAPVAVTGNTHSNLLVDGIVSTAGLVQGQPIFGSGITAGTTVASVQPSSLLLSANATATSLVSVPLTVGMSVVETLCGVDTTLVLGTDYEVETGSLLPGDEGPARLYRLNENGRPCTWRGDKVTVIYQAGYAIGSSVGTPLPADLGSACTLLVVTRFRTRGRDPTVIERNQGQMVGTERYWIGTTPGQKGAFPPEIESLISQYRVPVIG